MCFQGATLLLSLSTPSAGYSSRACLLAASRMYTLGGSLYSRTLLGRSILIVSLYSHMVPFRSRSELVIYKNLVRKQDSNQLLLYTNSDLASEAVKTRIFVGWFVALRASRSRERDRKARSRGINEGNAMSCAIHAPGGKAPRDQFR